MSLQNLDVVLHGGDGKAAKITKVQCVNRRVSFTHQVSLMVGP